MLRLRRSLKELTLISRYVLWNKTASSVPSSSDCSAPIREALASLIPKAPNPESFPQITRLAIRQKLLESGVGAEVILSMMDGQPRLRLASPVTIPEMGLSVRSSNCLKVASIETLEELLTWTPARLMDLPNFGYKCLNEITEIVHRLGYSSSFGEGAAVVVVERKPPSRDNSAPLFCLLQLGELVADGNLSDRFNALGWQIVADLAEHSVDTLVGLAGVPIDERDQFERALSAVHLQLPLELPTWFSCNIGVLRDTFRAELEHPKVGLSEGAFSSSSWQPPRLSRSLNDELSQLIPKSYNDRKRKIVSDLLGLGGKGPLTLDHVAKAQTPSLTRERVRQVAKPITDKLSEQGHELPWLLKAIDLLQRLAPCSLELAEQALLEEKILDPPIRASAILGLARRCNLEHTLLLEGNALMNADTAGSVDAVMRVAGRLSSHWGVADWLEIELLAPEAGMSSLKPQLKEVTWLDHEKRYLVLPGRENSLANRLARILTVTPRLKVSAAYRGSFRDSRLEKDRLPEELFAAFCNLWPWCCVEGDEVVAKEGLPASEVSTDDLLVLLLQEIGHPVRRRELTERALEHGLSSDTTIAALSYSNVIALEDGYFAVIGDPTLENFGNSATRTPSAILEPTGGSDEFEIVPDGSVDDYAALLMLAVEERVAALELTAPWSLSELRLSQRDRDRLLAWGRLAEWDFWYDSGYYLTMGREKVRKRVALGLAFLLFASEAVRRFGDSGSVWPAIESAMGERQQKLFMVRPGMAKTVMREAVEAACRTFGSRHAFEDVGQLVWFRTLGIQSGLLCSQIPALGTMLTQPANMLPLTIQLLLDSEGPNASASFRASWKLLQDIQCGSVSETAASDRIGSDVWLLPFPLDEILAQCLTARRAGVRATAAIATAAEEAYKYFSAPVLRWASDEAYLEYSLNEMAPPWRESAALILYCDEPFRRERVPIENDRWQLPNGPLRVPLTQRPETGFRFRLMQGKEAVFADWMYEGLSDETPFTFFRASGAMVRSADDVPLGEEVVLLHKADVKITGLDVLPVFRAVLRGVFRLTRLAAGAVARIQLIDPDDMLVWSLPIAEDTAAGMAEPVLPVRAGKWGTAVDVRLPDLAFTSDRLRLHSGEMLPITRENGRVVVQMSPGLARAQIGFVQGPVGTHRRSTRVKLQHLGGDFGAALEIDGDWQPLDGSATMDAATLRTQRMLGKVKGPLGADQDVCWMEGSRTLAGFRASGTSISGVHGLGESLNVVRGTYNSSQIELAAAHAITDGGFWRSVQRGIDGGWIAHLPFEGPLEEGHALWMWSGDSYSPREVPREQIEKSGFSMRWRNTTDAPVLGWAFSFGGARIGSVIQQNALGEFKQLLSGLPWVEAAMWLRWWHAPVLQAEIRDVLDACVRDHPLDTLKAWLLPAPESSGLIFDELREEAWAAASRELLWGWRPDRSQAVDLVMAMGIFTGNIDRDSRQPPPREAVGLLARMSPILLTDAVTQALPTMYPYPKPQLAVLLGMVLETINPNAAESEFRLEVSCERYAKSESRLDGRFILTRLVGAARALMHGEPQDTHNLRIAFHQAGLRELISIALLRDVFERWQGGTEA